MIKLIILLIFLISLYKGLNYTKKQREISKTAQKLNEIIDFERNKDEFEKIIKQEKEN